MFNNYFNIFIIFQIEITENFESSKVFVLSYENEANNDHKKLLEDKLKYYGYDYKFLGEGNENNLNGCLYERKKYHNNEFMVKDKNTFPFFIQTPAKYWICYDYLYKI